jgi:hypothetical protein
VSGFFLFEVLHAAVNNSSTSHVVGLVSLREVQIAQLDLLSAFCGSRVSIGKCSLSAVDRIGLRHRLSNFWQSSCGLRERIATEQLGFSFEASRVNKNIQNNPWQKASSHRKRQLPNSS